MEIPPCLFHRASPAGRSQCHSCCRSQHAGRSQLLTALGSSACCQRGQSSSLTPPWTWWSITSGSLGGLNKGEKDPTREKTCSAMSVPSQLCTTRQPAASNLIPSTATQVLPHKVLLWGLLYQFTTTLVVVVGLEETLLYASMGAFETCSCFAHHTMILHVLPFLHFSKAAKALLPVDEIKNKLKNVVKSQGHSKSTIIKSNEEIQSIRTQISQVPCCKYFNVFARFIRKRYFILKFPWHKLK